MFFIIIVDIFFVVFVNCISDICYVFDMGINIVGVFCLEIKGECGIWICLRYFEMFQKDGNIDQCNIDMYLCFCNKCEIIQMDEYVLKGEGVEIFILLFMYYGFCYIELIFDCFFIVVDVKF